VSTPQKTLITWRKFKEELYKTSRRSEIFAIGLTKLGKRRLRMYLIRTYKILTGGRNLSNSVKELITSENNCSNPDRSRLKLNSTSWVESDRALWSLLPRDSTQLNWLASFCQFLSVLNNSVELSWVELSWVKL